MERIKIIIVDDDKEQNVTLTNFFKNDNNYDVIANFFSGNTAVDGILAGNPDIVLLDYILPGFDGLEVLRRVMASGYKGRVIMMSCVGDDELILKAVNLGATYFMIKPLDQSFLKSKMNEILDKNPKFTVIKNSEPKFNVRPNIDIEINEKISNIMISIGIPPHIKGYQYIREGIKMAIANPGIMNSITKQLYPKISEQYITTASKVERAIRHAIEVAWNRGKIENLNNMFNLRGYIGNDKPTNGEFIALLADKLLLEKMRQNNI